jgi:hypothetical protein
MGESKYPTRKPPMLNLFRNVLIIPAVAGTIGIATVIGIGIASGDTSTQVSVHSQFGVAVDVDYIGGSISLKGIPAEPRGSAPLSKTFPANTTVKWLAKPKKPTEFTECSGEATVKGASFTIELTPGRCVPNFDWKTLPKK